MSTRRRDDDDFADEVRSHLELEADRLIEDGMAPADAQAAARKSFGNVARARERFHESARWVWLEQFRQDVRYALRTLEAAPAFAGTAVATLAVGLTLLTVSFTVFNAYVLRPFAVADASRLYRMAWSAPDAGSSAFSRAAYQELSARTDLFDAVVAEDTRFVSSGPRMLVMTSVSDNYFSTLRPRMLAGRPLGQDDAGRSVAVLAEGAAARLFENGRDSVGRTVDLDGHSVTIVGVAREEFGGLGDLPADMWVAAGPTDHQPAEIVVRIRRGVSAPQAAASLRDFAARQISAGIDPRKARAVLIPGGTANPLSVELLAVLSPVFAAFGLVLLAACVNVSNVMLARAVARHREIAVRLSLGAGRARIVRQLLTEGLLIAMLAGASALGLAAGLLRVARVLLFKTLPPMIASMLRVAPMPFDYRVFLFALGAAAAATLLFALLPAVQASRQPLTDALRAQRSGDASSSRLRNVLVVAQVAVSIVLVVTALVLDRNFTAMAGMDLGYATKNVYSVNVRGESTGVIARVAAALGADPRIASVAATGGNPLFVTRTVAAAPDDRAASPTLYTFVSPEFMPMLRMPISRGRPFSSDDAATAERVAIVSESTARAFWPGMDPIGRTIRIDRPLSGRMDEIDGYTRVSVVGTVPDVVSGLMIEGADRGHIYLPASAVDTHVSALLLAPRAPGDFRPDMLRETFRQLGYDPDVFEVVGLDEMRQTQMYPVRAAAWIGALLGGIALLLSVSGLYGVLSYVLAQRTREIGIRMALGATASAVVLLVMRQSARMSALGAAAGLAVSFAVLKMLGSIVELRQVKLLDPVAFLAALVVVAAATAVAAYYPSRRATRVDPAETLRAEA